MRDELDGRIWADHHEGLAELIDGALAALRGAIGRLPSWDGTSQHLLALVASFAITALSFNGTGA